MIIVSLMFLAVRLRRIRAHGYMTSPRSRNLLASEETVWWPQTEKDPLPEPCPHCLNLGGTLARCGIVHDRNYDTPKNALGGPMPTNIQATYTQGQDVVIDVTLTAHHKGHFVFSACPIVFGEIASQACFDENQLTFIEDMAWNANFDPNHPERAYIAPMNSGYILNPSSSVKVMDFSFKMRLPPKLYGEIVLIQWYYLTANSCKHDGYDDYEWPDGWHIPSTDKCNTVSSEGLGTPEQFWNCAEVRILKDENYQQPQDKPLQVPQALPSTDATTQLPALTSYTSISGTGSNDAPDDSEPVLLFCGGKQESQNIMNAETLVLSFAYELHRPIEGTSEKDAMRELKKMMLKSIAEKLKCTGYNLGRFLRTKDVFVQIIAVESSLVDKPIDSPCTIPINHDLPTICHSLHGSMEVYFDKGTPVQTLIDAREELLYFVRTMMSSGAYESSEVRRVVYTEDLSVGTIHSTPPQNTLQVLVWKEHGVQKNSILLLAAVIILSIALVGLLGFLYVYIRLRRKLVLRQVSTKDEPTSDEHVWQKALQTYESGDVQFRDTSDLSDGLNVAMIEGNDLIEPEGFHFKPYENSKIECKELFDKMGEAAPSSIHIESESCYHEERTDEEGIEPILTQDDDDEDRELDTNCKETLDLGHVDDEGSPVRGVQMIINDCSIVF